MYLSPLLIDFGDCNALQDAILLFRVETVYKITNELTTVP